MTNTEDVINEVMSSYGLGKFEEKLLGIINEYTGEDAMFKLPVFEQNVKLSSNKLIATGKNGYNGTVYVYPYLLIDFDSITFHVYYTKGSLMRITLSCLNRYKEEIGIVNYCINAGIYRYERVHHLYKRTVPFIKHERIEEDHDCTVIANNSMVTVVYEQEKNRVHFMYNNAIIKSTNLRLHSCKFAYISVKLINECECVIVK